MRIAQQAGACVAAVEAHECFIQAIIAFAFDIFIVDLCRYGVIDIQQCYRCVGYAQTNVFAQCAVNIYFTRNGNASACKTRVYITRNESEFCLECRPTFVGKCSVFGAAQIVFHPVFQCQFILSQSRQNACIRIFIAQFCCHFFNFGRDTRVIFMFVVSYQQIQFGVFFHCYAQIIQRFNRCVTSQEVIGTRAKCKDLQTFQTNQ